MRLTLCTALSAAAWLPLSPPVAAQASSPGTPEAIAVAERLLAQVGGRDVWAGVNRLYVRERVFPPAYRDTVVAEYWRDFERPAFVSRYKGAGLDRTTVWEANRGWRLREGQFVPYTDQDLAIEIAGSRQEPYAIYRRLARRDQTIQLGLVGDNRLIVLDIEGRTLCWFVVDAAGGPLRWGNVFRGAVNEHVNGPLRQFGAFRLPAWGAATDGSWRFEYEEVRALSEPIALPTPPK